MIRIAIFASGAGSNAENIIRHFSGNKNVSFPFLLCNKKGAGVLDRCSRLGVEARVFSKEQLNNGEILEMLIGERIDFVILAGFLLQMPAPLVEAYHHRIVNIHPALLPKFGGKGMYGHHVHEAVVAAGERESGITVHYADSLYDHGQIICQARCLLSASDSPDDVAAKVHELEYIYFPAAIEQVLLHLAPLA